MDDTLQLARLREIFDDDRESIVELLRECVGYVRRSLGELDAALVRGDTTGVSRAAHSIKGSCGNVGAIACERAAAALEIASRGATATSADSARLGTLVDAFEAAVGRYAINGDAPP